MALYAIGDFYLSFSVDKSMDVFGGTWKGHEKKIEKNCRKMICRRIRRSARVVPAVCG